MKVAVVGAGGYVGRRVMTELRGRDLDPIGIDVAAVGDFVQETLDLSAPDDTFALLHRLGPDVVIELAYLLTSASMAAPQRAVRVNVLGVNGLFDASTRLGVNRVIFASSNAVYGDQSDYGEGYVDEAALPRPRTLYGHMKQFNESMAQHYDRVSDTRFASLRLSSLHGRGKGGLFAPVDMVVRGAKEGQPVTLPWSKGHEFSFLHVDDAARAFAELAVGPEPQHTAYDSGGERLTMGELAEIAAPICGIEIGFDEPGLHIDHVSRMKGERLANEYGFERRSAASWLEEETNALAASQTVG
jgi:nucleoside-diphosphate-sugar epimerase